MPISKEQFLLSYDVIRELQKLDENYFPDFTEPLLPNVEIIDYILCLLHMMMAISKLVLKHLFSRFRMFEYLKFT